MFSLVIKNECNYSYFHDYFLNEQLNSKTLGFFKLK